MNLPPIFDHPVVGLLAAAGAVGLVYRLGRTLLRLGIAAAEATAVGGLLETSIRNGDLTGMAENREVVQRARAGAAAALERASDPAAGVRGGAGGVRGVGARVAAAAQAAAAARSPRGTAVAAVSYAGLRASRISEV